MDATELAHAWNDVVSQVKRYNTIDPSQIDAFFSRLVPQAMSNGFLMLTADNEFIKTWIERHYAGIIGQALQDLHGIPFTLVIEVDENQSTAQPVAPAQPIAVTPAAENPQPAPASSAAQQPAAVVEEPARTAETKHLAGEARASQQPSNDSAEEPEERATGTYTFENFVIGDSNRMAYSMAVAVAESPGKAHLNPLFIYGKSGLGKTHLLRAIQSYVNATQPNLSTVYVDTAELTADYVEASAAHDKDKASFRNFKTRYEEADVLLIDDVQQLQGRKQTLDILFQIFNKLTSQGRQVVLSADRAPKNIDIDERYKSRFNSGGTFDIQPPEVETKLSIVKSFIDEYRDTENAPGFMVPDDIQLYIAENSTSNIRELKSAVNRIIYQMTYFNQPDLTLAQARQILENHFTGGPSRRLTVTDVQREVEKFYRVSHADLVGKKRQRDITYARQVAIYLCRQLLDMPFQTIGKEFNRDHSTVMYSSNNVDTKLKENRELSEEIEALRQILRDL